MYYFRDQSDISLSSYSNNLFRWDLELFFKYERHSPHPGKLLKTIIFEMNDNKYTTNLYVEEVSIVLYTGSYKEKENATLFYLQVGIIISQFV